MENSNDIWAKVYKKNDEIVSREIAGETILVPIKGKLADMQRVFALENVSEFIWQHLDGQATLDTILKCLTESYDIDHARARSDIAEFIDELLQAELIVEAG